LNLRSLTFTALLALGLATGTVAFAQTTPAPSPTPTPLITAQPSFLPVATPAPTPTLAPVPSPTAAGGRKHRGESGAKPSPSPDATDTPVPPQFSTMDGVWEVALQPLDASPTIYSHFFITQSGQTLTGTWKRDEKPNDLPFTGTFDGRLFKFAVTIAGKSYTLSGYVENFGDMVGLITQDGSTAFGTPFTAQHRKKEKQANTVI
jgi:hypothetical protein